MVKYIIKRLLLAVFILVGVSIILYFFVRMMPLNAIENKFYELRGGGHSEADEAELQAMLERYNLADKSFWGIVKGWWQWIINFFAGDMGNSFQEKQPVGRIIFENMGISFSISLISLILEMLIAIPLGIKCACNQYGKLDYAATVLTMIGISFPTFFFGKLVIKFFAVDLGWFPANGLTTANATFVGWDKFVDIVRHIVLPLFVLTVLSIGSLMRYTRTNTLEVLNADYIRTARAKGLSENKVVYKHVFRNTMIPLVTVLASTLPGLFGGAMITETIFDIPGIGSTAYKLMSAGDVPFIMAYNMFIAVLTVIGILLADIMYAVVDPRVKIGK